MKLYVNEPSDRKGLCHVNYLNEMSCVSADGVPVAYICKLTDKQQWIGCYVDHNGGRTENDMWAAPHPTDVGPFDTFEECRDVMLVRLRLEGE